MNEKMNFPRIEIEGYAALENWLEKNHASHETIWLLSHKKSHGAKYVSKEQIAELGIRYGWVDGSPKASGNGMTMRLFARRKPDSIWSKANKERAIQMLADGTMKPAGKKAVNAAKRNGMWSYLDDVYAMQIPADLEAAFQQFYGSKEGFESFPDSSKILILKWIKMAKTTRTRQSRIEQTASLAAKGLKSYGS